MLSNESEGERPHAIGPGATGTPVIGRAQVGTTLRRSGLTNPYLTSSGTNLSFTTSRVWLMRETEIVNPGKRQTSGFRSPFSGALAR
jgi:hypothetical protein